MVYAFDSSTIELCLKLCPWAKFHHERGAIKMHTLMDFRGSIPTFVHLTEGAVHDSKIMDKMPVEANSYYLMDKGYVKFDSLYQHFHLNNAFFVTRAKGNMLYEVIDSREVDQSAGLSSDEPLNWLGHLLLRSILILLDLLYMKTSAQIQFTVSDAVIASFWLSNIWSSKRYRSLIFCHF